MVVEVNRFQIEGNRKKSAHIYPLNNSIDVHGKERTRKNPFDDWYAYNPSLRMDKWREKYESLINEGFNALGILLKLENLLNSDHMQFCDECEAMKCYGSLYPICEPALEKILKILQGKYSDQD